MQSFFNLTKFSVYDSTIGEALSSMEVIMSWFGAGLQLQGL